MSLFDALFGRTRLRRPQFDPIFRLVAALPDLEGKGLHFGAAAGLCCHSAEEQAFEDAFNDAVSVAQLYATEHSLTIASSSDREGYRWVVLRGDAAEDVLTGLHAAADTLESKGYGGSLLAAMVPFHDRGATSYLIYNYKRGHFYPFHPNGKADRDEARELQLQSVLSGILPIEGELERWYPLWDSPL